MLPPPLGKKTNRPGVCSSKYKLNQLNAQAPLKSSLTPKAPTSHALSLWASYEFAKARCDREIKNTNFIREVHKNIYSSAIARRSRTKPVQNVRKGGRNKKLHQAEIPNTVTAKQYDYEALHKTMAVPRYTAGTHNLHVLAG